VLTGLLVRGSVFVLLKDTKGIHILPYNKNEKILKAES